MRFWKGTGWPLMSDTFGTEATPSGLGYVMPYTQGSFATLGLRTAARLWLHYNRGKVYIRHILTHSEYDKGSWKK